MGMPFRKPSEQVKLELVQPGIPEREEYQT